MCNLKVTLITERWGVEVETKQGEKTKGEGKVVNCLQWGRGNAGGVHYLQVGHFLKQKIGHSQSTATIKPHSVFMPLYFLSTILLSGLSVVCSNLIIFTIQFSV